jgi:hypothetical protein
VIATVVHSAGWSLFAVLAWQPKTMLEWLVMTITTTGATLLTIRATYEWKDRSREKTNERPTSEVVRKSDERVG